MLNKSITRQRTINGHSGDKKRRCNSLVCFVAAKTVFIDVHPFQLKPLFENSRIIDRRQAPNDLPSLRHGGAKREPDAYKLFVKSYSYHKFLFTNRWPHAASRFCAFTSRSA